MNDDGKRDALAVLRELDTPRTWSARTSYGRSTLNDAVVGIEPYDAAAPDAGPVLTPSTSKVFGRELHTLLRGCVTAMTMTKLLRDQRMSPDATVARWLPDYWRRGADIDRIHSATC